MFTILAYLQFLIAGAFLLLSPILSLPSKTRIKWFGFIWIELYVAQLFMYTPGTDVSPYAYATSQIQAIRIAGLTSSAFVSIALLVYCFFSILYKRNIKSKSSLYMIILFSLIPSFISLLRSESIVSNIDYFVKIVSPFIVCAFIATYTLKRSDARRLSGIITGIHIFLIAQVLVCKVFQGNFAAYNYYYEMPEEYFGYYNHPHSFTGMMAVLSIWNVYQINRRRNVAMNLALFLISFVLIYISGVRTYIVTLAFALCYLAVAALRKSNMKRLRKYIYIAMVVVVLIGPSLLINLGSMRVTDDVSSGRFERWAADIAYALSTNSLADTLFGAGLQASVEANATLFGTSINSLNIFVDMFMDNGIIGTIMMLIAYYYLFKMNYVKQARGFQGSLFVFFVVASLITSAVTYVTIMFMIVVMLSVMNAEARENVMAQRREPSPIKNGVQCRA